MSDVAYSALNQTENWQKAAKKIECIIPALLSSGNALTKETAVHIIDVYSAYDYLFFLSEALKRKHSDKENLSMSFMEMKSGGYDLWHLKPNNYGINELWFDVNKPYRVHGEAQYKIYFPDED